MLCIVGEDADMEMATIDRLKYNAAVGDYIALTTEGEAVYLDDLRDCSVADILRTIQG